MSHPATRMLAMLELLQAHHVLGGPDLARRLGVDERTVRRYASRLAELGIPVTAERGRYGGYRLTPGYRLPPLMLTDDEATAVVLGLLAGRRLGLAAAATEAALAKIRRVLPSALREQAGALEETLDFTLAERAAPTPASRAVLALAAAIRDRRRVTLRHRSWKGDRTEREVDGHGLVFHSGRWYVTGHDHRSGDIRTFRVDRIDSVVPGTATYEIPEESDPVRQVTASLAQVPYAHLVEVVLHVPLAEAARRIPPSVATLTETPDGVLLRTRAESLDGMAAMIAGLGFPFTISSPPELRTAVRRLADRLREQAPD
ncbi:Predicted DNA-binding transcriptional regulator YafY, contains an HTH and WYL domains [Nonomuraea maritima]|uniref:Predicted DNA-binding transcriptional regulator YafY, contains an HTH and WYL domains n=1 Tax=Nonomuraea maritima TaxID=683260 RepID=A0A1G9DEP0_9ACTN|nr:YafY family protein [Nonomuraea maritima]SDK62346.1 Predicted DNA-binding transcriptional regulator YafY, contains an HTH and WYL domains [Nonomuraea maritima]